MGLTWNGVAQIVVLAWALAMLIPAWIYLCKRAGDRAKVQSDREAGVINGRALSVTRPPPPIGE